MKQSDLEKLRKTEIVSEFEKLGIYIFSCEVGGNSYKNNTKKFMIHWYLRIQSKRS